MTGATLPRAGHRRRLALVVAALSLSLSGCASSGDVNEAAATSQPSSSSPAPPSGSPTAAGSGRPGDVVVERTLADGLAVPWGLVALPGGDLLVAERDSGRILRVSTTGETTSLGVVPGIQHGGEGGLLGLAVQPADTGRQVYAYLTSDQGDNRVVRMTYGQGRLGAPQVVLAGIPSGPIHNGGRITFGPDGNLWIGTGESGLRDPAQDLDSLGGKILRITPDGGVPSDNPFPGSPVWSLGHRNVQGLAFDSTGQLWATEFGQQTWDELNRIEKGANYGWPLVEGVAKQKAFVDPLVVWPPEEASPSGLAIVDDIAYVAALRGQRLWQVPLSGKDTGKPRDFLTGLFGRLRTVLGTEAGGLLLTTSNRDGRGSPAPRDDRILVLALPPAAAQ